MTTDRVIDHQPTVWINIQRADRDQPEVCLLFWLKLKVFSVVLPSDPTRAFYHICLTSSWLSSRKSNIWFSWSLASCLAISMAFSHIWGRENKQTASKSEWQIRRHLLYLLFTVTSLQNVMKESTFPKQQVTYLALVQIAHDLLEQSFLQLLLRPARSSVPRDQVGCASLVRPLQRSQN